jgi:hypothetical protein
LLAKLPIPVPSDVLLSLRVGAAYTAQQTPRAVIAPPPSDDMFPPLRAVVEVIFETGVVVITGIVICADNNPEKQNKMAVAAIIWSIFFFITSFI